MSEREKEIDLQSILLFTFISRSALRGFFVIDQWSDGALFTLLEEIVSTIKLLRRRGRKKLSRGAALR